VILISHNMPQVFELADRIHIQRLGRRVAVVSPRDVNMSDAVAIMTGALAPDAVAGRSSGMPPGSGTIASALS
jgi:fructose transport system ATP-binding protein